MGSSVDEKSVLRGRVGGWVDGLTYDEKELPAFGGCAGLDDAVGKGCCERVCQRGGGQVQTVSEPYLTLVVEK